MSPPSFDNIINKFKSKTRQAADQMGRAAKIAKLKMDMMTQQGEKSRHLQIAGEKTYQLFCESGGLDGLIDRLRGEFSMIERIESRMRQIDEEIADLQARVQTAEVTDADEVVDVTNSAAGSEAQEGTRHE